MLFEYEGELRNADLSGANLSDAYLRGADLRYANLSDEDLRGADLRGADLRYADLRGANLRGADLRYANLRGANLRGANLSDADLSGAIKVPIFCKWSHGITGDCVHIGCEKRTIDEWNEFFASDETLTTPRGTQEFKQIEAVFRAYEAYINHLNKQ